MKDLRVLSDPTILTEVTKGIKKLRLYQNLTQEDLALKSGLSRGAVIRFEKGEPFEFLTLIQLLRGLNELDMLKIFFVPDRVDPLVLAKLYKVKLRASKKRVRK